MKNSLLVIIIVVSLLLVSYITGSLVSGSWNPIYWGHEEVEQGGEDNSNKDNNDNVSYLQGSMIISEFSQNPNLKLSCVQVAEAGETETYVVTATVSPANAIDKNVDFVVEFVNPNSAWAKNKDVNDYVTIEKLDKSKVILTCTNPFGEQIIMTAYSNYDNSITSTATIDYVKRVEKLYLNLSPLGNDSGFVEMDNGDFTVSCGGRYNYSFYADYTDGTLVGTLNVNGIKSILADNFYNTISADFNTDKECIIKYGNTFVDFNNGKIVIGTCADFIKAFMSEQKEQQFAETFYEYVKNNDDAYIELEVDFTYTYDGLENSINNGKQVMVTKLYINPLSIGFAPSNIELDQGSFIF